MHATLEVMVLNSCATTEDKDSCQVCGSHSVTWYGEVGGIAESKVCVMLI